MTACTQTEKPSPYIVPAFDFLHAYHSANKLLACAAVHLVAGTAVCAHDCSNRTTAMAALLICSNLPRPPCLPAWLCSNNAEIAAGPWPTS